MARAKSQTRTRSVVDVRKKHRTFYHIVIELSDGMVLVANPDWPEEPAPALESLATAIKELVDLNNPDVAAILEKRFVRFIPNGKEVEL